MFASNLLALGIWCDVGGEACAGREGFEVQAQRMWWGRAGGAPARACLLHHLVQH